MATDIVNISGSAGVCTISCDTLQWNSGVAPELLYTGTSAFQFTVSSADLTVSASNMSITCSDGEGGDFTVTSPFIALEASTDFHATCSGDASLELSGNTTTIGGATVDFPNLTYTSGAVTATGTVAVQVGGVTYKMLVHT